MRCWYVNSEGILFLLLFSHSTVSNSLQPQGAFEAPLSVGFPRQEHWSGLLFLSPGAPPDPGIEPASPESAGRFFTPVPPGKPI